MATKTQAKHNIGKVVQVIGPVLDSSCPSCITR